MVKDKGNKKKSAILGMSFGTADNRLRKQILFNLLLKCNLDICFQCGKQIENIEELSIEHKKPWLNSDTPKELFWSLDNIAFSHLKCNIGASENTRTLKHPSQESYKKGCRCDDCKEIQKLRIRLYRKNKKINNSKLE